MQDSKSEASAAESTAGGARAKLLVAGAIAAALALVLVIRSATGPGAPGSWSQEGRVSWYGPGFDGRRTASGEVFDTNDLTMAHRQLPFGSRVRVTNLQNGRSVIVRVNDRGPYDSRRIGDLSGAAATKIGMLETGVVQARLVLLDEASQ